ncbi:hypothetical protein [Oenococcus kitaharae]|uniref:Uncharacterized protein n=1 Tax=Oenococcus kitaharae DSM 17330 TaxID=1045004 RepID=G9WF43_9LACO|nr:hypothetical protein [Oenococcus kitaharae]EHN58603.1 hypothetical protein OKIT_0487 [Oenococcus kitaharae DSM 17330]
MQNYIIAVKQLFNFAEVYSLYPNIAKGVKGAKVSGNIKDQYFTAQQTKSAQPYG